MLKPFFTKLRAILSRISPTSRKQRVAQISNDDQTFKDKPQPLGFLDLPPEIRLIIYEMCLASDGKPTLRSMERMLRTELHYDRMTRLAPPGVDIKIFDIAVLLVCRKVHEEAIPVFYASHRFHHSLICNPFGGADMLKSSDTQFLRNLRNMKDISLDINQLADCPLGNTQFNSFANRVLSRFLYDVRRQCGEALRSLEIQLLCMDTNTRGLTPLLGEGATSSAIRNMRHHLQSLTIIGYRFSWIRPCSVLEDFCLDVAPNDMWNKTQYKKWPGVLLPLGTDSCVCRHLYGQRYVDCWQLKTRTTGRETG